MFKPVALRLIFSLPFTVVPLIMYFAMQIWIIPVIAYSIPVLSRLCIIIRIKMTSDRILSSNSSDIIHKRNTKKHKMIWNWLDSIGLSEYYNIFIAAGYKTIDDVHTISEIDLLKKLNINNRVHMTKILNKINYSTNRVRVGSTDEGDQDKIIIIDLKPAAPVLKNIVCNSMPSSPQKVDDNPSTKCSSPK